MSHGTIILVIFLFFFSLDFLRLRYLFVLRREYFYQLSYKNTNFDKVIGNPMSFQIQWDCMLPENRCEKLEMRDKWENVKKNLNLTC